MWRLRPAASAHRGWSDFSGGGGGGGGDTRFTSDASTPALLDPRAMNGKTFKSELDGGVFHALNAALNARHRALKRTEAPIAYKQSHEVDRFGPVQIPPPQKSVERNA